MKISHIEHLGIAVKSIEEALPYYENVLGLKCYNIETVEDQKVRTAFLKVGDVKIELLEPTSPESTIAKFIEKNNLPFTLIADTDKKLVEQFGVWGEKSMYGRKYMGTFRTTFLINEEGIVERIITPKEVKTKEHASQILNQ